MATSPDFIKDPDAVLDFMVDWSAWLASGESITAFTAIPSPGINVDSTYFTSSKTTVWLSGGSSGTVYQVTHRVTTNQGRTDDRTMYIRASDR